MEFSKLLKEARKRAQLTQQELADKVGIDDSYISKIEKSGDTPSRDKVLAIIDVLGITDRAERSQFLLAAGCANFDDINFGDAKRKLTSQEGGGQNNSRGVYESPLSVSSIDILISSLESTEKHLIAAVHGLRAVRGLIADLLPREED
jgi:transcriptional regulator with XRE-family HTH domain